MLLQRPNWTLNMVLDISPAYWLLNRNVSCILNREEEHTFYMLGCEDVNWGENRDSERGWGQSHNKWRVTHSYCYTVNNIMFPGETVLTVWECRWEPAALCPSGIEVVGFHHYHLLRSQHGGMSKLGMSSSHSKVFPYWHPDNMTDNQPQFSAAESHQTTVKLQYVTEQQTHFYIYFLHSFSAVSPTEISENLMNKLVIYPDFRLANSQLSRLETKLTGQLKYPSYWCINSEVFLRI